MIITRFPPSPTGELHIGGARTALFAYLFAKKNKGKFLLRIEDTDRERYVEGSVERIIESMDWLGLVPDNRENIMIQSQRLDVYKTFAKELVRKGLAYICTCDEKKLAKDREEQTASGLPPKYKGHCRNLGISFEDVKEEKFVIRMKLPETGRISFKDLIRGEVNFDLSLLDDQIILKSDGFPTYHLAAVVDDHEMGVTHVIRGEEWLPSTPKHILLYQMFGWQVPEFAHLSMILSPDKTKLSKRQGATGVFEYKKMGYLPQAITNFIALLGWHPKDNKEIFSLNELIDEFDLMRVQKAGAVFDVEKLNWINSEYIKKLSNEEFKKVLLDFYGDQIDAKKINDALLSASKERTVKLSDFIVNNDFVFNFNDSYPEQLLIWKNTEKEIMSKNLKLILEELKKISEKDFSKNNLEKEIMPLAIKLGKGESLWPLRASLSGKDKSPGPFELLEILGKKESLRRVDMALDKLV